MALPEGRGLKDASSYRWLIGQVIYLIITSPKISYLVYVLSVGTIASRRAFLGYHTSCVLPKRQPKHGILMHIERHMRVSTYCGFNWVSCSITWWLVTGSIFYHTWAITNTLEDKETNNSITIFSRAWISAMAVATNEFNLVKIIISIFVSDPQCVS